MGGFEAINNFYETIAEDNRIGNSHISLYVTLLYLMQGKPIKDPLFIYRARVMQISRMSRRTYNKCMRELVEYGYIKYEPSSNPAQGSKVILNKL